MLWWLVIILGFALGFYMAYEASCFGMGFMDYLSGFLIGCLASVAGLLLCVLLMLIPETKPVLYETTQITALKDNSSVQGTFFLGSGSIKEDSYYFYMTESNKGKKMEKVRTDKAYIKEGKFENTYVETYEMVIKNKFAKFLFGEVAVSYEYIFHVPENSVTTEFNVDME